MAQPIPADLHEEGDARCTMDIGQEGEVVRLTRPDPSAQAVRSNSACPIPREGAHMKEFAGRIAVVTGGGSGMGRELVRQLVAEACNVSICDLAAEGMAETVRLCEADRWRILVGADAHKVDEMVRQSPEPAYDLGFFDEFARAAGWTERASLENPEGGTFGAIRSATASGRGA